MRASRVGGGYVPIVTSSFYGIIDDAVLFCCRVFCLPYDLNGDQRTTRGSVPLVIVVLKPDHLSSCNLS